MRIHRLKSLIPALALAAALPVLPTVSHAGIAVGVSITVAPPILPVYVQPPLPAPGYMWTPGYWAWGDDGYYWVPGTWVMPPQPGVLWTPGYWGWDGGVYLWHGGYWGPHIGFYGGVNYGFGYGGVGFVGGYWHGGSFFYNHACANFGGVHVTNVYNHTVINNYNHVSFNGGHGGLSARPTGRELAAEHDHHFEATGSQREHQNSAAGNREMRASFNHGSPAVAATSRAGQFSGHGVVGARGSSGPHGGPTNTMAHNGGPAERGSENHGGGAGPGVHGGAGAPGGGHTEARPMARNDMPRPGASGAGGAQHGGSAGNFGGGSPRPGTYGGGASHGGSPGNVGGGAPRGGANNFGGGAQHGGNFGGGPRGGNPGNVGGGAPRGGSPGNFGGAPRGGGGAPHAAPAPRPSGGGHPNGGGGRKPEGHR